jgi:hypothetical protein
VYDDFLEFPSPFPVDCLTSVFVLRVTCFCFDDLENEGQKYLKFSAFGHVNMSGFLILQINVLVLLKPNHLVVHKDLLNVIQLHFGIKWEILEVTNAVRELCLFILL